MFVTASVQARAARARALSRKFMHVFWRIRLYVLDTSGRRSGRDQSGTALARNGLADLVKEAQRDVAKPPAPVHDRIVDDILDDKTDQGGVAIHFNRCDRFACVGLTQFEVQLLFPGRSDVPIAFRTPQRLVIGSELHKWQRLRGREGQPTQFLNRRVIEFRRRVSQSQARGLPRRVQAQS